ncbi:class I SAM-dependent methyltransferase [Sorangium sp. So ce1151]|uniref:class I SAM-dependent methyltransferase n=1 Tax=Sorangium sp. So ce1151 TaxID=3133332 RepID=UPI003F60F77F
MRAQTPSRTAEIVAAHLVLLSRHPAFGAIVPPEAAAASRWFLEAIPGLHGRFYRLVAPLLEAPLVRASLRRFERHPPPSMALGFGLRRRWIEDQVRTALAAGCSQLVVLGAGFDTLAYRLHRALPGVRFWEIDHPATQGVKRAALDAHGGVGPNLTLLPVDFTQRTLDEVLSSLPGYDPRAATAFLAEGLLMYLAEAEVRATFQAVHAHSGEGSQLVGTAVAVTPEGRLDTPGVSWLDEQRLRLLGEPVKWGLPRGGLGGFLSGLAFALKEEVRAPELLGRYLPSARPGSRLSDTESFFLAARVRG